MAIVAPAVPVATYAQDLTVTVTLSTATNVNGWTCTATLRGQHGGTALATKTIGSGITVSDEANGVFVVSFSATDLTQTPGPYVWEMYRSNSGFVFPIVDPSLFIIRPSNASAYPTLVTMAGFLAATGGSETVSDTDAKQLLVHLGTAEAALRRICNRQFVYGTYTEYLAANWTDRITLKETPIQSITSIYYDLAAYAGQADNAFDSTTLLTSGTDYFLVRDRQTDTYSNCGQIIRVGCKWEGWTERPYGLLYNRPIHAPGSIKVTYTGGYGSGVLVPFDLQNAIYEATLLLLNASENGRLKINESGEGYSYGLGQLEDEIKRLGSTRQVVAAYKRIVF